MTATTATDPRVDRWHAQLEVNLALRKAGVFGRGREQWRGWADAQAATMRELVKAGREVHRRVLARLGPSDERAAAIHFAAIRVFCP